MAGAKGRSGGGRPGAGRPKSAASKPKPTPKPRSIDWNRVDFLARHGVPEADIRLSLDVTDDLLDASAMDRFKKAIARGHACHRVDLEVRINRRSVRTSKADGSVNVLALLARNKLDFDRQIPTQEVEPDLGTARQRLGALILRLAQQTSQVENRHVSVLELLQREAEVGAEAP